MPDAYTTARAREIVNRTIETIADMWPSGMPVNHGVAKRFDESLAEAIRRSDVRTVERDCKKYQIWMAQQITKYTLG